MRAITHPLRDESSRFVSPTMSGMTRVLAFSWRFLMAASSACCSCRYDDERQIPIATVTSSRRGKGSDLKKHNKFSLQVPELLFLRTPGTVYGLQLLLQRLGSVREYQTDEGSTCENRNTHGNLPAEFPDDQQSLSALTKTRDPVEACFRVGLASPLHPTCLMLSHHKCVLENV